MKRKLQHAVAGAFALCCLALFAWWNATKPRVLVLHSYDTEYAWSREVSVGLHRVLDRKNGYSIRWHYMDTKRHPWPDFLRRAGIGAQRVVEQWRPDVVIAIDDDAQKYVMKSYVNDPKIRIVFAGINGDIGAYGYDRAPNATGIVERVPWSAIRETLLGSSLAGRKSEIRVLHLGDLSESVAHDAEQSRHFDWWPLKLAGVHLVETFDEWKARVRAAEGNADVILISNYRRLVDASGSKRLVDPKEVVAWTEANSKLPLIGLNGYYAEDGGMLSVAASPYEQGEVAAGMAVRILDKRASPDTIPVETTRQFIVSIRAASLAARDIRLPVFYESFARATNTYH